MADRRGRPPGKTKRGEATRQRLYDVAVRLFAEQGYDATTLRQIAREAEVSPATLYKHFPGKQAVVLALYAQLSTRFAEQVELDPRASWHARVEVALRTSLEVLQPHRKTLGQVLPVLLVDQEGGLLSRAAYGSRALVRDVYVAAVAEGRGAPGSAEEVGRLAYLLQLGVLLWWLLDRSEDQRATWALIALLGRLGPAIGPMMWIPGVGSTLEHLDALVSEALYDDPRTL